MWSSFFDVYSIWLVYELKNTQIQLITNFF